MKIFSKFKVGRIIKVGCGILRGKYAMIAKEHDGGFGVVTDPSDWPSEVPAEFNAIFISADCVVDIPEEAETMLKLKFPNPEQFE